MAQCKIRLNSSLKISFLKVFFKCLIDLDNSDEQDGPSDADFWKGPLQETDEKSQ